MFAHNLLIAYRSFLRNKSSFLINILGLTTGLTSALFIFLWVQDEVRMDAFHENGERLYQVMQVFPGMDASDVQDWTPGPLAVAMEEIFPEVERAISVKYAADFYDGVISHEDQFFKARPLYADSAYFNVLSYPLLLGHKNQVLRDPYAVVISEALAIKLFDSVEHALGKTIKWDKKWGNIVDFSGLFTVTGVYDSMPEHSAEDFDLIFSMAFYQEKSPNINLWSNDQASTYVVLRPDADARSLDVEIIGVVKDFNFRSLYEEIEPGLFKMFAADNNYGKEIYIKIRAGLESATLDQLKILHETHSPGYPFEYSFVDDTYQALYESEYKLSILSRLFAGLAIVISCLGLFGLSTFTAERRTKEIGIRKILGASVWEVVRLLSSDFTKMVSIAILIALPTTYLIAGYWLDGFSYSIELKWWFFIGSAATTLIIAWLTVGFQTFKAAMTNPTECLQYE